MNEWADLLVPDAAMTIARQRELAVSAQLGRVAPRLPWDWFLENEFNWQVGEHVALIGPTGQGKTTLMLYLLDHPLHPYQAVFATKPKSESMDMLVSHGYVKLERWQSLDARQWPKRVLWPNASAVDSTDYQRQIFTDAMARIYREGGWTVAIDELWYVVNELKLGHPVRVYLLQARELDISLLVATQRPAWVPTEIYDQSTHLFFWRDNDERNLSRISGISRGSSRMIQHIVANLDSHQVLYVNTRTGRMVRTRCPKLEFNTMVGR